MNRRHACQSLIATALSVAGGVGAQSGPAHERAPPERLAEALSLYGVTLKDADAEGFLAAARAAGGTPLPGPAGSAPRLDMRAAGVPALERLTLLSQDGKVARVEFTVKGYGQDNVALRGLLVAKYGAPYTVSARPLRFGGFDQRAAPSGGFQWYFADGMRLVYQHPRVGDVTLSYVDDARVQAVDDASRAGRPAAPPVEALRDRL
jgi:hypothetical protein